MGFETIAQKKLDSENSSLKKDVENKKNALFICKEKKKTEVFEERFRNLEPNEQEEYDYEIFEDDTNFSSIQFFRM